MTTLQMEIGLMFNFDITRNTIVNGVTEVTGLVNFESDLLILSKSRYATCIEIKISKADLKNDLKKRHISQMDKFNYYFKPLKYFYYAVPPKLEEEALKQIPAFAGLLIVENFKIKKVKEAKKLFNNQWTENQEKELMRLGCLRIYNLKRNINLLQNNKKN